MRPIHYMSNVTNSISQMSQITDKSTEGESILNIDDRIHMAISFTKPAVHLVTEYVSKDKSLFIMALSKDGGVVYGYMDEILNLIKYLNDYVDSYAIINYEIKSQNKYLVKIETAFEPATNVLGASLDSIGALIKCMEKYHVFQVVEMDEGDDTALIEIKESELLCLLCTTKNLFISYIKKV